MPEKSMIDIDRFKDELDEYKKFAFGKNLLLITVSLVLGTSLQKLGTIVSEALFMPVVNYLIAQTNGNWRNLIVVPVDGMNLEVGRLLSGIIEFMFTSVVLYFVYSRIIKKYDPDASIESMKAKLK
jgi:large-conductance mechanosensitive channel